MIPEKTNVLYDKTIIELAKACSTLRSIKTKKHESRRDYVALFTPYYELFTELVDKRDTLFECQTDSELTRPALTKKFVSEIRKRQEELGVENYLLNDVKFGFIVNIVNWLQHPELLEKQTEYRSRTKDKATKKRVDKRDQILKIRSMSDTSIILEITQPKKENYSYLRITSENNIEIIQLPAKNGKTKILTVEVELLSVDKKDP